MRFLIFKSLTNSEENIIKQVKVIYEESFPLPERKPLEEIIGNFQAKQRILYVVEDNAIIQGFALVNSMTDKRIIFLDYIAVKKEARNLRIGSKLLDFIRTDLRDSTIGDILLFEVESPNSIGVNDNENRKRRMEFYFRNGANIIEDGGVYKMPDFYDASKGIEMRLMWIPIRPKSTFPYSKDLQSLFKEIYKDIYDRRDSDFLLNSICQKLTEKKK